jgi:hypothetical protein
MKNAGPVLDLYLAYCLAQTDFPFTISSTSVFKGTVSPD